VSYGAAVFYVFWAGNENIVFDIGLRLPDIAGMGFLDIDCIKCRLALILLVQLVELGNLPAEGRSSVTAKYQHHGLVSTE
jgi:hypothetical protein